MTVYYVSTSGNDINNGLSEEYAWQTITYAATQSQAGDSVYIKGGNYGHEHVVISNSGTASNPIIFEGYDGVPVIDGKDRTGNGIYVSSKKYIKIKNIKVTQYEYGVLLEYLNYITLDNIIITNIGGVGYNGWGIRLLFADYCNIWNCEVTDARGVNFQIGYSNHNLIENCAAYGIETDNPVDYYIVVQYSHDNIVRNCISENKHRDSTVHAGHGIGIKDYYYNGYRSPHSYNNTFINCETHGHGEHFYVAHPAHDNEFINCIAYNDNLNPYHQWNVGFRIRDGAYNNNFTNCIAIETQSGALFYDSGEASELGIQTTYNNIFTNCIFINLISSGIAMKDTRDNTFTNCVIRKAPKLFGGIESSQTGNLLKNSIIQDVAAIGLASVSTEYSNFWNNGFNMPTGTGNMENDPQFADITNNDFHLKSIYGRWDGSGWTADSVTSPCIDAGNPVDDYTREPEGNGGRINMGAYGNTEEASLSSEGIIEDNKGFFLVGKWYFDEVSGTVLKDESGYGNDGTIMNGYAIIENNEILNITDSIIIKATIIPNVIGEGGPNVGVAAKGENLVDWSWQLRYNAPDGYMGFNFNDIVKGITWVSVKQNLVPGQKYQVEAKFDNNNVKCYLDGIETDSNTMSAIVGGNSNLFIGQDGWNNIFDGTVYEVEIYRSLIIPTIIDLVFMPDEIKDNMNWFATVTVENRNIFNVKNIQIAFYFSETPDDIFYTIENVSIPALSSINIETMFEALSAGTYNVCCKVV